MTSFLGMFAPPGRPLEARPDDWREMTVPQSDSVDSAVRLVARIAAARLSKYLSMVCSNQNCGANGASLVRPSGGGNCLAAILRWICCRDQEIPFDGKSRRRSILRLVRRGMAMVPASARTRATNRS